MCGKLFADMGAEVIKIEPPGTGDEARSHPPFPSDIPHPEKSGLFLYLNTSKKSLTLDVSRPSGASIFKRLIKDADILIENRPPSYMQSLGLGYDTLKEINPRLIMTSISPFGQTGPYRDWKGSDLVEWAMSLTGYNTPTLVNDTERENPLRAPGRQADRSAPASAPERGRRKGRTAIAPARSARRRSPRSPAPSPAPVWRPEPGRPRRRAIQL